MSIKVLAAVQRGTPFIKSTKEKSVTVVTESKEEKSVGFDGVFSLSDVDSLFRSHLSGICSDALSGYNVNITGCGLSGVGSGQVLHGSGYSATNGIIPTIIKDLFAKTSGKQYLVSASMLQISHNGDLLDILNPHSRKIRIRKNHRLGIFVDNLSSLVCSTADECCALYSEGYKSEMALKTLRRDVVFTLYVSQKQQGGLGSSGILSKIVILDLIGHETALENTGIKQLFKFTNKGKIRDESVLSPANLLVYDAMTNSKFSTIIACATGEESNADDVMRLLELAKMPSGNRLNPQKNSSDLTNLLTEIRRDIKNARGRLMEQNTPQKKDVSQLEELIADLNDAKRTGWEQRIALSNLCAEERNSNLANRGLLWVLESNKSSNHEEIKELQERVIEVSKKLKEQKQISEKLKEDLKTEIDGYGKLIESGKSGESETKARVSRIQSMKESFKRESEKTNKLRDALKQTKEQLRKQKEAGLNIASFNFEMTARKLQEDRNRMKKENQQIVDDEVEKMKIEVSHEKAELEMRSASGSLQLSDKDQLTQGVDLAALKFEKSAITTQLDVLRKENRQMEDHLHVLAEKHTKQTEIQQLQNLQTFRAYREVFEEFKTDLDNRWRGLLDDAIQDAVFLNSRNNELVQENERLNLEVKQLKDALSFTGTPPGKVSSIVDA